MVARAFLVALVLELVAYVALARHALLAGWSPWTLVAFVLAMHFGLRALAVCVGYAIALVAGQRDAHVRLTLADRARLVVREVLAMWRNYALVPFEPWLPPEPDLGGTGRQAPRVVLVHGILCNRASWWWFRRALARRGHPAIAVTLEPALGSLDAMADALARTLRGARAPLYLVAHSMGGLVSRRLLQRHPDLPVAGLVTLGTPHAGSLQARLAFGDAARALRRGSLWLNELDGGGVPRGVHCAAIWSWHDELVSPAGSCRWACADNLAFTGVGHVDLLWSPRIVEEVARRLDRWIAAEAPA
ncbi:MAG: alpha/beta fold hydrolase [Steroidobacteraceae bacterium]|jgi:pimeloyl-ACP methyl ester carboxylesterase|nr:alpha/beta fold hydrolase [Steroidobacteraceae bacterium]